MTTKTFIGFKALAVKVLTKGGFTIDSEGNSPDKEKFKYLVSLKNYEKIYELTEIKQIERSIKEYFNSHIDLLYENDFKTLFVGAWVDNGKLYLDISEGFSMRYKESAIAEMAQERGQKAYYNLWTDKTVYV